VTDLSKTVEDLWELHRRFVAQSGHVAGSDDDVHFLALAVGGETGEVLAHAIPMVIAFAASIGAVQNQVKKSWRGFGDDDREKLEEELGDAFTYWALLGTALGIDVAGLPERALAKAHRKIAELEALR
jgi:NTP pyrophosphatase (non-canonical NTP hydrolase)